MGADYIEPDLVSTKDGYLIARHEPNIRATTDVEDKFPERMRDGVVDGGLVPDDFFASDFTLKEIRTLRARQPLPAERPTEYDGKFKIPTFDEVLELAKREGRKRGRVVGVYPETKHPTYHQQLGLPLERKVVDTLKRHGLNHKRAAVIIQSFEQANLRYLNRITPVTLSSSSTLGTSNLDGSLAYESTSTRPYDWTVSGDPLLTARTYGYFATNAGLDEIARYADIVAPWKPYIVPTTGTDADGDGRADDVTGDKTVDERDRAIAAPTSLIRRAHKRGLDVHTWTFRNEPRRLAGDYFRGSVTSTSPWTRTTRRPRRSTSCSSRSASTACSPTSRTRRSRPATSSSPAEPSATGAGERSPAPPTPTSPATTRSRSSS